MVAHLSDTFSLYSSRTGLLDISQIIQAWLCIFPLAYNAFPPNCCNLSFDLNVIFSVKCLQILTPTWVSFSPVCPWGLYFPNGLCFHLSALPAGLRATWQVLCNVSPSPAPWKDQVEWPFHRQSVKEQGHVAPTDHSCPFPRGGSPASWGQGKNYNNTRPLKG